MRDVFEKDTTIKKWDDDYYHPISLWLYDRAISDMLRFMEIGPGETILDAGCGPGVHSIRIAKAGMRVCAVDISKRMLWHAQQRAKSAGVSDKIEFYQKDLTEMDFPDAYFNYVFSWGVVIHIPEAERALDEMARIVKPGGKLALYLTNKTALDHKIESFVRLIMRKPSKGRKKLPLENGIWYENDHDKLWVWRFDANAITEYLSRSNFRLIKRHIGELSQLQVRFKGLPRRALLKINNIAYRLSLPPHIAAGKLLVFEKEKHL